MTQMNKWKKGILQVLAVVVVLALALGGFKAMSAARKPPEKKGQVSLAPLVKAVKVAPEQMQITVMGYGTVKPCKTIQVVPQVQGRIVQRHEGLVDGGFFRANEALAVIEKRDFQIAAEMADATVAQAQVALETARAEGQIAKDQWKKMNPGKEPENILVYHEPQIRSAEAQLRAARVQLEKAKLDLERTQVSMPFDGRILSTEVDVGQFVTVGKSFATAYATDAVEIDIPLENEELQWLDLVLDGSKLGPLVSIGNDFAGAAHCWEGRIIRTKAQVDARSRMVYVVVRVANPFETSDQRPPLIPGMFVSAGIQGKTVPSVVSVPRHAIRAGDRVWLDIEGVLRIRPVTVLRTDKTNAYVSKGLTDGDVVITSPIDIITEGMTIRTLLESSSSTVD
jgi:RND family efflux transporter MFP subunit